MWLEGDTFTMGSDRHEPGEAPTHRVGVAAFGISPLAVTDAEFAAFVRVVGYVTIAERPLDEAKFPGAPPENLSGRRVQALRQVRTGVPLPDGPVPSRR